MKLTRNRLTLRHSMAFVALVALMLCAYRALPSLLEILDDGPFNAIGRVKKSWDLGPSPSVTVDVFEGTIQVNPSPDHLVSAEITAVAQCKYSQSDSDVALGTIDLELNVRGDSIRISVKASSGAGFRKEADVDLYVPQGVHLDVRTGRGEIRVGRGYSGNGPVHQPIAASSVRARNDSRYRLGYAEGNIIIETIAPPAVGGAFANPTRLQLDAAGQVEILARSAIVEARAWHGLAPKGWTAVDYENEFEGRITFEGSLAKGDSLFRAAHAIAMKLSGDTALEVDAEAVNGAITGDLLPRPLEPLKDRTRWKGVIGSDRSVSLHLRTDDGPIRLNNLP
jgi:hypothetical protein